MERPRLIPINFLGILQIWCCLAASAKAQYVKYKDPSQPLNVRIKDLMGRMTLEEKIGQMIQIERNVTTADIMRNYFIGSVLSGGGSTPGPQASPPAWINMINELKQGALSSRLGIPMIYGIDAVHGHNNVYNATICSSQYWSRDPILLKRIGAATSLEVRATGIPYAFAPCIRGFVISDWEVIDRITSPPHANYTYSIQASINAGLDMIMLPYNYT
ncbi:hypothetical protein REPUB_Repub06bG0065600 [Reevesia pubescens]